MRAPSERRGRRRRRRVPGLPPGRAGLGRAGSRQRQPCPPARVSWPAGRVPEFTLLILVVRARGRLPRWRPVRRRGRVRGRSRYSPPATTRPTTKEMSAPSMRVGDRTDVEGGGQERDHRGEPHEVGDQAAPGPAAVDAVRVEDLGDGVVPVPDKVEVDEVDRGPRDQEVEHQEHEVVEAGEVVVGDQQRHDEAMTRPQRVRRPGCGRSAGPVGSRRPRWRR